MSQSRLRHLWLPLLVGVVSVIAWPVVSARASSPPVSLAGQWRFALDEKNEGVAAQWFARSLPGVIRLPGSVDEAGVVTNTERPTLMRLYRPHKYTGVAWFQRTIEVPAAWKDRHIRLLLERCHWETQVWVDERHVGMQDSLCVPHEYDLGQLSPGPHRLTIRVDNHLKYNMGWQSLGPDMLGLGSHMLSEDTQTNWNGIVGRMELAAAAPVRIADPQVYPDLEKNLVRVRLRIANAANKPVRGTVQLMVCEATGGRRAKKVEAFSADGAETELLAELPMGPNVKPWDEFAPTLYRLVLNVSADGDAACCRQPHGAVRHAVVQGKRDTIRRQWAAGLLARHAQLRRVPANGIPGDRRGLVAADIPDCQVVWAEFHAVPLLVSAGGRLCRGRPGGILPARRRPLLDWTTSARISRGTASWSRRPCASCRRMEIIRRSACSRWATRPPATWRFSTESSSG